MWKFYTPASLSKRPKPNVNKLAKMIYLKVVERIRSFDAQFLLFWVVIVLYLGFKKRLFFKIGWLLFRQIKQFQVPLPSNQTAHMD